MLRKVALLRKFCLVSSVALLPAALGVAVQTASAGKPVPAVPVKIGFVEQGDPIKSDRPGVPYVDGQEGVEANIYTSTGDLRLSLSRSPRRVLIAHTTVDGAGDPRVAVNSVEGEAYFLNVGLGDGNLLTMDPGDMAEMRAFLSTDGYLRFDPVWPLNGYANGSTRIWVKRLTDTQWEICSGESDLAVLVKSFKAKGGALQLPAGYFHLPFKITVTALAPLP